MICKQNKKKEMIRMNTNNKKTNKTINKGVKMNKPKRNIK